MQKSRIDILNGGSGKQIGNEKGEQKIIGRSHAKGGVDVKHASGEDYELEGGEVVDGDRVFSVKLKSQSGESFAAVAESFLKAKKKANDALKVASAQNKDKIRKKIKAIEEELSALFAEQQAMNGDSTGEYAAVGTEMGTETLQLETPEVTATETVEQPVMETTTLPVDQTIDGGVDPLEDIYKSASATGKFKNYFKSFDDFKAMFSKDEKSVSKLLLDLTLGSTEHDTFKSKLGSYFSTQGKDNISKSLGIYKEKEVKPLDKSGYTIPAGMIPKGYKQKEGQDGKVYIPVGKTKEEEKDFFTGDIGYVLKTLDSEKSPIGWLGLGDFIDDMGRAISSGYRMGAISTPANELLISGKEVSEETLNKYIQASKEYDQVGPSQEMINFTKTYEEGGKGLIGFLKGLAENPSVLGEIILSSTSAMINPASVGAAGTAIATGAGIGAATGAAPGAVVGAVGSVPYALAAAGTVLETGSTFSELLNEELKSKGLKFDAEGIKKVLEDDNALNRIRTKSIARGVTIGAIDALTGRVAGKVGANMLGKTKASTIKAGLTSTGIEAAGGAAGEAAARGVIGQEMDVAEIALEGVAEVPMSIPSLVSEVTKRTTYTVNGENVSESDVEDIINNSSPEDLASMKIDIKNDIKGYKTKIDEKVADGQLKKEVVQANPGVDEATIDQIVSLEKELKSLEANKTQSGKDRANAIKNQIKSIQETATTKQPKEEVVTEAVTEAAPEGTAEVTAEEKITEQPAPTVETVAPEKDTLPMTGEVERTKSVAAPEAKEGTFINVGLKEGTTDNLLTEEDITSKLPEGVEVIEMSRVEPESGTVDEPTLSIKLSRPLTDAEMSKLLSDTKQKAIPQMSEGVGAMYGTTEWGPFDGYYFITPDGKRSAADPRETAQAQPTVEPIQLEKEVYTTEDINKLAAASDKIKNPIAKKIVIDAANVIKALQSLAKTKVNIHTTRESYNQSMDNNLTEEEARMGRGTTGYYIDSKGEIHISLPDIESNTIYHEAAHPVLNFIMKQDPAVVNRMSKQVESLGKSNKSVQEVVDWANEGYDVEIAKEEKIVEFIARVADGRIDVTTLNKSAFEKVKNIINEMLGLLLGDNAPVLSTVDEVISAAQTISEAFKTGRELQAKELETKQMAAAKRKKPAAPKKKERVVLEEVEDIKEMIDTKDNPKPVDREEIKTSEVRFKKELDANVSGSTVAAGQIIPSNIESSKVSDKPLINVYESKEVSKLPIVSMQEIYNKFGGKATAINTDPTRVGELTLPSGKKIFMYGGPYYTAIKDNESNNIGFATTQKSKVKTHQKLVNKVFGDSNGVTLIVTQSPESVLGNSYALRYVLDAISQLPKTVRRDPKFKSEFFGKDIKGLKDAFGEKGYNEFVSKYKNTDFGDQAQIDDMIEDLAYKLGDNNPKSFKARRKLLENLLGGVVLKSMRTATKNEKGYVSVDPSKYIAKQLLNRFGLNTEKLMYEIAEKKIVDSYMNDGQWGFAVAGFESSAKDNADAIQDKGVVHPLFNAKFPGKNNFVLDGAYQADELFLPEDIVKEGGKIYKKKASQMLAGSMYVGKEIQPSVQAKFKKPEALKDVESTSKALTGENLDKINKEKVEDLVFNYIFEYEKRKSTEEQKQTGSRREGDEGVIKEATDVSRRFFKDEGKVKTGTPLSKPDSKSLEKFAKENGLFIENYNDIKKGRTPKKGVESEVYMSEDGMDVIKINNGTYHLNWLDFFKRILAHNIYFPSTRYKVIGFTKRDGRLAVILSQPRVDISKGANRNDVQKVLESEGLEFKSIYNVSDPVHDVKLRDFHEENAVYNQNGEMVFIDPIIEVGGNDKLFRDLVSEAYHEAIAKKESDRTDFDNKIISDIESIFKEDDVRFKKPEKGVVLVPKKYKIDTDGEGNFLFYHYGKIKGDKIDPKYFGKNRYTSDQRRNGVSYFYTKSTDQESMVSGDVNVIKVPMEKVYPFNKDPLNFYDQAEANFRKDFPNGAFDAVKQIDYMNPLIQKAGFDMTVAEWSTFPLRAETTKALPIDKKLTEAMREFGGFSTKDMRDKYEIDIVNKISDAAQKPTRKGEIIAEKFYGMGGSDASVTKLMKDKELRAVVGKPLFDKWNNTLPESKKVRFKKPEQRAFPKMEQSENMIGEKTGKWTLNNGFTIEESGLGSDKVFIIKQNGKKWATGLTLAQARSMVNNRARFKKPEKKYGDTIQRYMSDPNQPQMIRDIIENTNDLDFSGVKFPVINNLADRIIADALANNELDKLVTDLESVSSSKDVSGPLKVFILQKALEVAKVADMPNLAQKILIKLNEISSTAARTLRSLASNTIPESVMYSLRDRLNTARNKKLGKKKLEALENLYSEIQDILDSSIDESLNSAEIEALILKAINEGQVFPMTLEEFNKLNGEIASLKAQLQSAINNARATSPSNIYGVNLGSVQNNTVTNASTGQSRTVNDIMTELATKIMMRGNVTEKSFKQEMGVMLRKMGILATDAEVKGYYDSARNNPDVQEKLAQAGTAKGKARAQEISEKALKDLLSQVKARIAEYAKNHWNGNATQARNFKNEILEIFGPNSPIAQEIADKLEEVFNNKVKEAAEKVIQKELGSRKIPTPKQVKEAQSITQKILGHIYAGENAGVLDTDMFINLFADKYGFTGLTQEQMDVLKEFADVMAYTAPGSAERKKWMARMELYVKKITTPKWRFVLGVFAMENFYSAVLSGYTTFWRASTGVIYTSLGELAVEAMVQQIQNPKGLMGKNGLMSGLKKMLDGFKNQSWDQAKQYMKDGVPINNKFEAVQTGTIVEAYNSDKERESLKGKNIAAYIGSKVFRSIYWPVAMMARSIGAMDALITAPLREYYAKNAAMNELLREGMDQNDANFFKEMEKLLYRDEASVKQARQQAEEEYAALKALDPRLKKLGFRTSSNYINQRTYEILDSYRDAYIQEYSEDMQVRSRLMGTPTGTAGVLYESVTYLQRKFPGFTYIVPFARVPLNALNEWVSWSPYGLVRGVLGKGAISRTLRSTLESPVDHLKFGKTLWDVKGSPKEARENVRDLVKGVLGSAIMAIPLMIAMTAKTGDEEEEPERGGTPMKTWMDLPFRVTSDKPENMDYRYINELKERNLWFPNSFRIKIGKFDSGWIGYLDMPFASSLAPAGYIMDNKFITTKPKGERIFDDKGTMDQIAMGMMPYATFIKNQSFIKGIVDFATIFADERVPQEKGFSWAKTGAAALRFGTGIAKGLIYPNFYKQSYITYKSIVGEEQKVPYRMSDADMDPARYINESMAYNFPFWEDAIENKAYDSFGLPVPYDIAYNRIGDAVLNNVMWNYVLPNTPIQWMRNFYGTREGDAAWDFVIDRQLEIPRIPGDGELSFDDNIKFKKLALGKFYEKFKWHMDNSYSDNTVELLKLKDYEAKKDIQDVMSVMAKIGMTYAKDQMLLDTAKTEEQRKLILNLLEYQTIQDLENGTVDRWLLYNPQINKLIMESPTIERETKMETRPSRINE